MRALHLFHDRCNIFSSDQPGRKICFCVQPPPTMSLVVHFGLGFLFNNASSGSAMFHLSTLRTHCLVAHVFPPHPRSLDCGASPSQLADILPSHPRSRLLQREAHANLGHQFQRSLLSQNTALAGLELVSSWLSAQPAFSNNSPGLILSSPAVLNLRQPQNLTVPGNRDKDTARAVTAASAIYLRKLNRSVGGCPVLSPSNIIAGATHSFNNLFTPFAYALSLTSLRVLDDVDPVL